MNFVPLLLMYMWSRVNPTTQRTASQPAWPTAASPPPMMPQIPAFQSQHPSANTGTPLSQLHSAPPEPIHADATNVVTSAKHAATSAAKHAAKSALHSVHLPNPFGKKKSAAVALKASTVEDLQTILISHGAKLTKDGLYGPKTASAWQALAKKQGLNGTIKRVNPTVAQVATHTLDMLSVPPIP